MSDRLPNSYSTYPDNYTQGSPTQQTQQRSPQQPQQLGSPPLVGISNGYRYQQQQQQQAQQQHSQQPGGEPMHGGVMSLTAQQQQVCLTLQLC